MWSCLPPEFITPQDGAETPPYNVAKRVLDFEFSISIARDRLRPGYGDGFLGAPLRTGSTTKASAKAGGAHVPRDRRRARGESRTDEDKNAQGSVLI